MKLSGLFGRKNKTKTNFSKEDTKSQAASPNPPPSKPNHFSAKQIEKKNDSPNKPFMTKPAWSVTDYVVAPKEGKTRFHDLNLVPELLHGIADLKYEYCSDIQAESLPHTLQGHDVIGKAATGTGKTAAFLITIINDILCRPIPKNERYASEPRALILAPTRELAMQIEKDAIALTKYCDVSVYSVLGGIDYQKQKDYVRGKIIDILVATPGRLIDFLNSNDLYLDQLDFHFNGIGCPTLDKIHNVITESRAEQ